MVEIGEFTISSLDEFKAFFELHGVQFAHGDDEIDGIKFHVLSVSQAHFYFSGFTGKFLGVLADEMGDFEPKIGLDISVLPEDWRSTIDDV